MIAFFGMGLLGSNFVRALRRRGEEVQVWNRSPEKAVALETVGARSYANPAEAAAGAARVHLTLSDDAAVDQVLEQAAPGLMPGTIIVDHTTTLASGIADRTARFRERGITFVHAPVFMGPQNALESSGIMKNTKKLDAAKKLMDWLATPEAMELFSKNFAVVAVPGIAKPLDYVPADYEQRLTKNDFAWSAKNRDKILAEWTKRYDAKSEKK